MPPARTGWQRMVQALHWIGYLDRTVKEAPEEGQRVLHRASLSYRRLTLTALRRLKQAIRGTCRIISAAFTLLSGVRRRTLFF